MTYQVSDDVVVSLHMPAYSDHLVRKEKAVLIINKEQLIKKYVLVFFNICHSMVAVQ